MVLCLTPAYWASMSPGVSELRSYCLGKSAVAARVTQLLGQHHADPLTIELVMIPS
jgi:hypothetical protein